MKRLFSFLLLIASLLGVATPSDAGFVGPRRVLLHTSPNAYLGIVATRCFAPVSRNTSNRQVMARNPHYARDTINRPALLIPNFWVQNASPFAEQGVGSTATITASVEYPAGTFTQITFGGSASGSIADNTSLLSDRVALKVPIPRGALFWTRLYYVSTTGVVSAGGLGQPNVGANLGAGLEAAVSGLTDKTMSGTVTTANNVYAPLAIVDDTRVPSVALIGDSKVLGQLDTTGDVSGNVGNLARSLGPSFGYSLMAQNGDRALSFLLSHANRSAVFAYVSHVINGYGSNDVYGAARSGAQTYADSQSIAALSTAKFFNTTIEPRTTSTDSWATTINQTLVAGNSRRVDYNTLVRAGAGFQNWYFDLANAVETSFNSGLWDVDGTANKYTSDGIHETTAGNFLIVNANVVDASAVRRSVGGWLLKRDLNPANDNSPMWLEKVA